MPTNSPMPTSEKTIFNQVVIDPSNVWYVMFLGFSVIIDFAWIVSLDYYRKTNKPRAFKIALGGVPAFLSLFFIPDLLYFRPYDLNAIQMGVVIVIWIVGVSLIIKGRNKLFLFLFKGKNFEKQKTKKHTQQKTNDSNGTNKEIQQPLDSNKPEKTNNRQQ